MEIDLRTNGNWGKEVWKWLEYTIQLAMARHKTPGKLTEYGKENELIIYARFWAHP